MISTTFLSRSLFAMVVAMVVAMLSACGGGEEAEPVTFIADWHEDGLVAPQMALRLLELGVAPQKVECGWQDGSFGAPTHAENGELLLYVMGGTPYTYFTFSAEDAERVKGLPWGMVVDAQWRANHAVPGECLHLPP
jgi:hypothetical protein